MSTITVQKALLQQALEALGVAQDHWHTYHGGLQSGKINEAITALRAALAQPEQEPCVAYSVDWGRDGDRPCCTIIKRHANGTHELVAVKYGPPRRETEQEPVARVLQTVGQYHTGRCVAEVETVRRLRDGENLYTHPPRREWRSLSEEEIWNLAANCLDSVAGRLQFARAIEQALKEKNHE